MAGRICDQLKARFGNDSVYMDIDSIPPGIDFRDHIYAALDQADVLLVIVGPKWLGTRRGGRHRITEDHDLVRAEVETALKRKIPVVPILVDGAVMPESASLPDSIKTFTRRNAAAVDSGVDFHQHMERLVHAIGPFVGAEPLLAWLLRRFGGSRRALRLALSTAAVIAVLVAALWGFWSFAHSPM
jgi:hypothetical protein